MTAAKEVIIETPYGKARHPLTNTDPAPTPPASDLRQIPLTELVESPWNPRKHFDPAKLVEMADSLRKGQLAPIIVRPLAANGKARGMFAPQQGYEIGAGHRRFRSAPAAGMTSLLAIVREMNDVAFLELLTIENKQRDDVAPLDEANGFKLLMEKAGYDVGKLAARIGLSTKYVYDRLKLLQLTPEAKKLLEDGTITAGHAILLARLTPADQKRVIGDRDDGYYGGGLLQGENADHDPNQPGLKLDDPIKARSVRELATFINDNVRFDPAKTDLPNLFPATARALEEAKDDDLKPVYISFDHSLRVEARDPKTRTYAVMSWRRADGQPDPEHKGKKSSTCPWSRVGIVAAGPHRGDALRVCVNRDKCGVHFPAAKKRHKQAAALKAEGVTDPWERDRLIRQAEEAKQKAEDARYKTARPKILAALREKLSKAPATSSSPVGRFVLRECAARAGDAAKYLSAGKTAEDLVRHIAFVHTASAFSSHWRTSAEVARALKQWGIDAPKIVDEVAPKPKAEKKPISKKAKKAKR